MSPKSSKKKARNWTNEEVNLFVEIVTDEEFNFELKMSPGTELF